MQAAMVAISKSMAAVQDLQLSSPLKNGTQYSTLAMCKQVLTDSLEQVNTSLSRISNMRTVDSLKSEVGDVQQYMAAALTYQDTCLTGVQDFGVWKGDDALNGTHGAYVTMLLSNALSLVNSLAKVTTDWSQVFRHSRRRLLALSSRSYHKMEFESSLGSEFPSWLSRDGRRLLQSSSNPTPNAVVATDGSGKYTSIQAAVDAAPASSKGTARWVIYVKKGVYSEYVSIPKGKKNLMMYGDGPGQTVITGSKSVKGSGVTTFYSATFGN